MKEEIHKALIALKFVKEGRFYKKDGSWIKVFDEDTLEDMFKKLIVYAKTVKLKEIKQVLEIKEPNV